MENLFADPVQCTTLPFPLSAAANQAEAKIVEAAPKEPTIGEQFAKLFEQYQNALDCYIESLKAAAQFEQSFSSRESYSMAIQVQSPYTRRGLVKKVGESIRSAMVDKAQKMFAPRGGRLEIDDRDLQERFPIEVLNEGRGLDANDRARIEFDPAACWAYLEATYGGSAGEEIGWRQNAADLIRHFGLRDQPELKKVAGRTVLEVGYLYTEKTYSGQWELSYNAKETILKVFSSLQAFAAWAELWDLPPNLNQQTHRIWYGARALVTPRERFDLGENCHYVTYLKEWKFHLSAPVAEKLQLFLGQYGKFE